VTRSSLEPRRFDSPIYIFPDGIDCNIAMGE
jgi:hypothetical protein